MRKKIISAAIVLSTITFFAYASQPKTVVGTAAMTVGNFSSENFVMPTMPPFRTLQLNLQTPIPIISTTPRATSTPNLTASPHPTQTAQPAQTTSATGTPKPTAQPTTQATTQPTTAPASNTSYTDQVITLVNNERAKAGLGALTKNAQLTNSAQGYAQYMADKNFFSHEGPDGSTFITRNKSAGYYPYRYLGENIAAGQRTPQEVMTAWMNSSGHRANILKPEYKEIGVGYTSKSGTTYNTYWAQEFGAK